MSVNTRCPKCNALMPDVEGQKIFPTAGVVLWRGCRNCGYKWREGYELTLTHRALPWTKPPEPANQTEDDSR
jgi:C4-type Zn-finger protein